MASQVPGHAEHAERAQTPKSCELCEMDTGIKYKCMDCNKLLCDKCRTIHAKLPSLSCHDIYDLKSPDLQQVPAAKMKVDNMPCQDHVKKFHCMFCNDCEILVCPECISCYHQRHSLGSIEKACEEKIIKLETYEMQIEKDLLNVNKIYENLPTAECDWERNLDNIRKRVDDKESEILQAVTKYAGKLRDEIERNRKDRTNAIMERKQTLEEVERNLKYRLDKVKHAYESKEAEIIFTTSQDIISGYPSIGESLNQVPRETVEFYSRSVPMETISETFGFLSILKYPHIFDLEIVKSFSTDLRNIETLLVSDGQTAWVSTFDRNEAFVQKLKIQESIQKVKSLNCHAFDMAWTNNNILLVTIQFTSDIKFLSKTGELNPFINVSPYMVKGIHVTKDDNIIVSVREAGEPFEITENSCRKLIVYGADKKEKHSHEFDKNNRRLFIGPRRITTNVNGDIIVSDWTSHTDGRVIALGKEGDLKWTYEGHDKINSENNNFRPYGIVTTSEGHIIVADTSNHAIHILSALGDPIICKLMDTVGVSLPKSLCIDTWRQLWIGCKTYKESENDAKIHVVKLLY